MTGTLKALEEIADSFLEILEKAKKGDVYLSPEIRGEISNFLMQTALARLKLANEQGGGL